MSVGHAHESRLSDASHPPSAVPDSQRPSQRGSAKVELLRELKNVDAPELEPWSPVDTEAEHEPIGDVDKALVLDRVPGQLRRAPIVQTSHVGSGIVDAVGHRLWGCTTSGKVSISQRA